MKKKVLLITTGGTVAQVTTANGFLDINKEVDGGTLLGSVLPKAESMNVKSIAVSDIFCLDSSNLLPEHWVMMIREIEARYDEFDAFVITHGTDTLSYSCAALAYALGNLGKPVVLTGAQVPFRAAGSDALMNLENAIRVAAQEDIPLCGIVCVFGSLIVSGTRVKKISEFNYDSFESFNSQALGRIGARVRFNKERIEKHNATYGRAMCREALKPQAEFAMDKIVVLNEFPGMCWEFLKGSPVRGVVLRSYAGGNSNVGDNGGGIVGLYEYLRENRIPIAVISQPDQGVTTMEDYKPGRLAKGLGGVPVYDMSTEALVVKMGWLVGQGLEYDEMREALTSDFRGEISC